MVPVDEVLSPWLAQLAGDVGGLELVDAHTHIGRNDPDGFRQEPQELTEALEAAGARGVVFPMHEPDGYTAANDEALAMAEASGRRVAAFSSVWLLSATLEIALLAWLWRALPCRPNLFVATAWWTSVHVVAVFS